MNYNKIFGQPRIPKQFKGKSQIIKTTSLVSFEEADRLQNSFARNCELLQADECEALSVMDDIVAGGKSYTKKINRY